ncbi:MAG: class I SAM-dependent methyltransferase [Tannerella sp.]|jgi:ubiquinone/menaquinone biosynthesis C-methylase UbiE|nr:class I SAM-dependent methyltransferase [Tannerella sp.]
MKQDHNKRHPISPRKTPCNDISTAKTETLASLIAEQALYQPHNILVVGCGSGFEAGILARKFDADTIGIDLEEQFTFDHASSAPAKLMKMNAQRLEFDDDRFDLVYSFHALEHIEEPEIALNQMARVLKPGGFFCIGTPNKSRLIGYIGAETPLVNKIRWNWNDWCKRVTGQWDNALGAHAGFTVKELQKMCKAAFGDAHDISTDYYKALYSSMIARRLFLSPFRHFIMPGIYIAGVGAASG